MRSASRLTSGRNSTWRTTLKTAALAPIPSASISATVAARPLACRSERIATRTSCRNASAASTERGRQTSRIDSCVSSRLPNSFIAARRAASGSSPRSTRSWMLIAMWPRISSSKALGLGRKALLLAGGRDLHDAPDRLDEQRPAILLARELSLAGRRQPVELGLLVRLAHAPFGLEPAALLEPVE